MKFFLDTANLDELRKAAELGLADGVTTNPTLIAKEGNPIEDQIRRICDIVNGDVSAEVVATKTEDMVMGTARSPEPDTFKYTVLLYVPGASVSATLVVLNRMLFGVLALVESTVSQIGSVVVSTEKNGAGLAEDVTLTST